MTLLAERQCVRLGDDAEPLDSERIGQLQQQVPDWDVDDDERIWRVFEFEDFAQALAFVNRVGQVAEQQNHHPDIYLSWGNVKVELSTHSIGGLSENDFIVAAKIDQLAKRA
jgi:4a-hydroxytetrahydrobiopterin dehydratase